MYTRSKRVGIQILTALEIQKLSTTRFISKALCLKISWAQIILRKKFVRWSKVKFPTNLDPWPRIMRVTLAWLPSQARNMSIVAPQIISKPNSTIPSPRCTTRVTGTTALTDITTDKVWVLLARLNKSSEVAMASPQSLSMAPQSARRQASPLWATPKTSRVKAPKHLEFKTRKCICNKCNTHPNKPCILKR